MQEESRETTVEIVIKIDKRAYERIKCLELQDKLSKAIANGIILPDNVDKIVPLNDVYGLCCDHEAGDCIGDCQTCHDYAVPYTQLLNNAINLSPKGKENNYDNS